jgi:aminoglycoside 3-N-acetyltransferase
MTEAEIIARTRSPATVETLSLDVQKLGVEEGDVLLVHCSLSAAGWVNGGAVAMVHALLKAVGPAGTVAMPAHFSRRWAQRALWLCRRTPQMSLIRPTGERRQSPSNGSA